jgi:two-component system, LytTR family, sensor kinase
MIHKLTRFKWHVLFWAIYFVFWTLYSIYGYSTPPLPAFLITFVWFLGQASVSYLIIYGLIPRFFNTRRYLLFALLLLTGLLLSATFILAGMTGILGLFGKPVPYSVKAEYFYILTANFYTAFLVVAVKFIREKVRSDRRNALLEKEKTENELRFLKSQMNPHFLFNAINSIYVLIKKDPDFAGLTLVKFADMLRYQLYECNADEIPIEKEIGYLDNYIELEKLRKGKIIETRYTVGAAACNFSIAPLLLIPFVENAFKYVSSCPNKNNFVTVDLNYQDDIFELSVENTMDEDNVPPKEKFWGGIGLENVRRRLELIYKGRHALDISTKGDIYSVLLTIKVK